MVLHPSYGHHHHTMVPGLIVAVEVDGLEFVTFFLMEIQKLKNRFYRQKADAKRDGGNLEVIATKILDSKIMTPFFRWVLISVKLSKNY